MIELNVQYCLGLLGEKNYYTLHDPLEAYWNQLNNTEEKIKVQALIQLTVALHHNQALNEAGYNTLLKKAEEKLKINFTNQTPDEIHLYISERLNEYLRNN